MDNQWKSRALLRLQNIILGFAPAFQQMVNKGEPWTPPPEYSPPTFEIEVTDDDETEQDWAVLALTASSGLMTDSLEVLRDLVQFAREEGATWERVAEALATTVAEVRRVLDVATEADRRCDFCGSADEELVHQLRFLRLPGYACTSCVNAATFALVESAANGPLGRFETTTKGTCYLCSAQGSASQVVVEHDQTMRTVCAYCLGHRLRSARL